MIRQAHRRNADALRDGRVRLIQAPVERLQVTDGPFDAALAVNTVGMWPEPATRLREIGQLLRPGGRIAVVSQPRCPGATAATSAAAGDRLAAQLSEAGFAKIRVETMPPRPAGCVRPRQPKFMRAEPFGTVHHAADGRAAQTPPVRPPPEIATLRRADLQRAERAHESVPAASP
jgi:SAM-dependent methyltransferase